ADIVVLDDLCSMNVSEVFFKGKKAGGNELDKRRECPSGLKHTIHLENFSKECLKLPLQGKRAHVIQMEEGQITTKDLVCQVPGE
ncbi:adenine deaminase, partial [Clostridium sp. SL.3.18]|nr:adenine deaminase [Clostridium sp. SL.3.18]